MPAYLIVFVGAGFGGVMRHGVNVAALRFLGAGLSYGTLIVNIVGSLIMGLLTGYFTRTSDPGQAWRLFLITGMMGGFTTFSAFSLDTVLLYEGGQPGLAALYVAASVAISIVALIAGLFITRHVL